MLVLAHRSPFPSGCGRRVVAFLLFPPQSPPQMPRSLFSDRSLCPVAKWSLSPGYFIGLTQCNSCQISHTGVKWQLAIYLSWFLLPAVSQLSLGLQVAFLGGCSSMGGHQLQEAEGWGQLLTLHGMGKDGHTQLEVHCMENSQTLPFQYFCSPPWCRHFCALQLRCFFHPVPTGLVSSRKFIRQMMNNMNNQQLENSSISFESWSSLGFVF